ncbi:MAG: CopD family protein [Anaerolineales bacterium]|nr:CopD family protein [Chloroflexota bacterium]MBL6980926.1 CopD family protein [Anaerolineales bacterium]
MNTPTWALTSAYWLHMLATVIWIGGLAILTLLVIPAARKILDEITYATFLENVQRRLDPLAWFSVVVLLGSGMLQMSANPNYDGFLAVNNPWGWAILVKHIVFGLMVLSSGYVTWGIMPSMRRAAFRQARHQDAPEIASFQKREWLFLRLNLTLGIIVLALTALARAS